MVLRSAQDYPVIYEAMEGIKQRARESGLFVVVDSDLEYDNPVVQVSIDPPRIRGFGLIAGGQHDQTGNHSGPFRPYGSPVMAGELQPRSRSRRYRGGLRVLGHRHCEIIRRA